MEFFSQTEIENWKCIKAVEYYYAKNGNRRIGSVLGKINKDLKVIINTGLNFNETQKQKAQHIINNWKEWTSPVRKRKFRKCKRQNQQAQNQQVQNKQTQNQQNQQVQNQLVQNQQAQNQQEQVQNQQEQVQNQQVQDQQRQSQQEQNLIEKAGSWSTGMLIEFLLNQNLQIDSDDLKILRELKIAGYDFFDYSKKEFMEFGLQVGPATRLAKFSMDNKNKKFQNIYK